MIGKDTRERIPFDNRSIQELGRASWYSRRPARMYPKKRCVVDTLGVPWTCKANPCLMTLVPNPFSAQTTARQVYKIPLMPQSQLDYVWATQYAYGVTKVFRTHSTKNARPEMWNPPLGRQELPSTWLCSRGYIRGHMLSFRWQNQNGSGVEQVTTHTSERALAAPAFKFTG